MIPEITFEDAERLSMETDYAVFANEDVSKINSADAAAFFLEGYNYARKEMENEKLTELSDAIGRPIDDIKNAVIICAGDIPGISLANIRATLMRHYRPDVVVIDDSMDQAIRNRPQYETTEGGLAAVMTLEMRQPMKQPFIYDERSEFRGKNKTKRKYPRPH